MRHRLRKPTKAVLAVLLATMLMLSLAALAPAATSKSAAKRGASWLATHMSSKDASGVQADAVDAFYATKRSEGSYKKLVTALQTNVQDYAVTAGGTGKLLLAAVTAGENPRCFGAGTGTAAASQNFDLVEILESFNSGGRYGESSWDQGLAMLGLVAAHEKVSKKTISFVMKHRGKNGWGFGLSTSAGDDVESTGLLIEALRASGVKKSDKRLKSALRWMSYQVNTQGGMSPDGNKAETQANATAAWILAKRALGFGSAKANRALRRLQQKNGGFYSMKVLNSAPTPATDTQKIATVEAVVALSGKTRPVRKRQKSAPVCTPST